MFGINAPHWHLLFNHLPVVGGMFSTFLVIYAFIRNNSELKRAALTAWIVVAIVAFVADQTGGPASRAVRGLSGVNNTMIREHADSADFAGMLSYVLGGLGLVGLIIAGRQKPTIVENKSNGHAYEAYRRYKEPPSWVMILVLIVGLVQVAAMVRTANLGGAIRHPEINVDSLSHMIRTLPPQTAPDSSDDDD